MRVFKLSERNLPKITCVYALVNTINGKIYIGSAAGKTGLRSRMQSHKKAHKYGRDNHPLYKSILKNGLDFFEIWVLEECEPKKCLLWEQYYLDTWEPWVENGSGYNICKIAGSSLGVKRSEELKLRWSLARKGVVFSEERKNLISKKYTFVDPEGNVVNVFNLSEFCRINKLNPTYMSRVSRKIVPHYKGWRFFEEKNVGVSFEKPDDPRGRNYALISPEGEVFTGKNISKFCREKGLGHVGICRVMDNKVKHHKGWRKLTEKGGKVEFTTSSYFTKVEQNAQS